jgi:hypothetical protein
MNKKPIGSRQAAKLAREKFGERAYVARSGGLFQVNVLKSRFGGMSLIYTKGAGKSWEKALIAAGVTIPADAPYFPQEVVK